MSNQNSPFSERSTLAAELVLGLLDGQELLQARQLALGDREFAEEVRRWQALIDVWFEEIGGIQPRAELRAMVEAGLEAAEAGRVAAVKSPPWKSLAMIGIAASLIFAIALGIVLRGNEREPTPSQGLANAAVGQINGADGTPLLSAAFERSTATLYLRVADLGGEGTAPELWLIPKGGAPKSLGLIRAASVTISVSPEVMSQLAEQATLAITVEPVENAPHSAPTGPIIGTAELQSL